MRVTRDQPNISSTTSILERGSTFAEMSTCGWPFLLGIDLFFPAEDNGDLFRKLNIEDAEIRWVLVLPPWGHLYHWRSRKLGPQTKIPWADFFDLKSLGRFPFLLDFV